MSGWSFVHIKLLVNLWLGRYTSDIFFISRQNKILCENFVNCKLGYYGHDLALWQVKIKAEIWLNFADRAYWSLMRAPTGALILIQIFVTNFDIPFLILNFIGVNDFSWFHFTRVVNIASQVEVLSVEVLQIARSTLPLAPYKITVDSFELGEVHQILSQ